MVGIWTVLRLGTLAQFEAPGLSVDIAPGQGLAGGAFGAFLTTAVIGLLLVALAPEFTQRMMGEVLEEPIGTFVYGVVSLLALLLVSFILFITIIGILIAFPVLLVAYVVWGIGAAIAYLAIADRLIGHEDGWTKPILVGAAINGVLTLTGLGGILAFCIGAAGFGAILRERL